MRLAVEGSSATLTEVGGDVLSLFIVENSALEKLLFDRNMVGGPFRELCLEASRCFISHIADELPRDGSVSELVVLSKGVVYQIQQACLDVCGVCPPTNMVATQRAEVAAESVRVETLYQRFEAGGTTLILGDTVASGATVISALTAYLSSHRVNRLYVMSLAGSLAGARRIASFCLERSISVSFLYGLAAFGLGANGFDLSFLDPHTVTRDSYRERSRQQFEGRPVSAVGWDFGSQVTAPTKYRQLCWMEAERWGLHGHASLALEEEPPDMTLIAGEAGAWQ